MKCSVLVLTFNEERNIERCLRSFSWCQEMVVVDSGSSDRTVEICQALGATVLSRKFDTFSNQRNFGLDSFDFKTDWVLHIDADEECTEELRSEIEALDENVAKLGFYIPAKTILNGFWLKRAGMWPTYQARLGNATHFRFKEVGHGQREAVSPKDMGRLESAYLHHAFSHGIQKWLSKHVIYAAKEADEIVRKSNDDHYAEGSSVQRRRKLKSIAYNVLPRFIRPSLRFAYIYFFRLGFLDGRGGLYYARMMMVYEQMIVLLEEEHRQFG